MTTQNQAPALHVVADQATDTLIVRIKPTHGGLRHSVVFNDHPEIGNYTRDFKQESGWYEVPRVVGEKLRTTLMHFGRPHNGETNPCKFDVVTSRAEADAIVRAELEAVQAVVLKQEAAIGTAARPVVATASQRSVVSEKDQAAARLERATEEMAAARADLAKHAKKA